jgi:hypothetical protein
MLGKVKAMWERFTGVDELRNALAHAEFERNAAFQSCRLAWDRVKSVNGERDRALADCEAQVQAKLNALRWVDNLNSELETARRTAALHRSLIAILRDVNRDLDERLNALESKPEVEATT